MSASAEKLDELFSKLGDFAPVHQVVKLERNERLLT